MKAQASLWLFCLLTGATCAAADGTVRFVRHAVLLRPSGRALSVRENIALRNNAKETVAGGAFRFYVPDSAGTTLRVAAKSPNGTRLQQAPVKTAERGVYRLDLPIEPGDTQLDLSYTLPFGNPGEFRGRTLQTDVPVVLVVPPGVTVEGEGLSLLGQEQKSGAANYRVATPEYRVLVRSNTPPDAKAAESEAADSVPSQILPRVYDNVYAILGFAFGALGLGFIRLYRMRAAPVPVRRAHAPPPRRVARQRQLLSQRRA